jgi:hypothetical protein
VNHRLQAAREAIRTAAGGLSGEVLTRKVDARWSIAEILEHLTLAFTAHAAALEKPLASGELRVHTPALKQVLGRVMVVEFGYFPRVEAPSMTRPSGTIPAERALTAIDDALETLDRTLDRVEAKFGAAVPVTNHPYFGGMSVNQWRKFHWRHTVHHMKQVTRRSAGPRSAAL